MCVSSPSYLQSFTVRRGAAMAVDLLVPQTITLPESHTYTAKAGSVEQWKTWTLLPQYSWKGLAARRLFWQADILHCGNETSKMAKGIDFKRSSITQATSRTSCGKEIEDTYVAAGKSSRKIKVYFSAKMVNRYKCLMLFYSLKE